MQRREFLWRLPGLAAATAFVLSPRVARAVAWIRAEAPRLGPPEAAARDEDFWGQVARAYGVDRSIVNLNNGGVSPSPRLVLDALKRHLEFENAAPAYTMWRVLEPQREAVRQRLAREVGCDPEEVALTRNASEGLEICQFGMDLRAGDEVLTTDRDYPRMLNTFRQRERREGIRLKLVSLKGLDEDPTGIVRRLEEAITPRTKLMLVCHMIFLNGQVLPVRDIVAMARRHGVPVIVDGAHALFHLDFRLPELECDYYAASLHKWLCAPHGTGFLFVRREKIAGLWPLMAANPGQEKDIRKFEEIGTHPAANYLAIAEALTFHQTLGGARKEARLRYLRDYWIQALRERHPDRLRVHTPLKPGLAGGIATVSFARLETKALHQWLWRKHRILTTVIHHADFEGLRVSPHVYTTLPELDRFVAAVDRALRRGL